MELSTTRESTSCVAPRQNLSILLNPKVHYRIHKISPVSLFWAWPIHTTPPYLYKIHFNTTTHLRFGLPSGFFL
jgi:hypothetical protein